VGVGLSVRGDSPASYVAPASREIAPKDMDLTKIKDLKDLQSILDLMGRYDLVELELECEGQKVRLRKTDPSARGIVAYPGYSSPMGGAPGVAPAVIAAAAAPSTGPGAPAPGAGSSAAASRAQLKEIPSPMVGTFYRAPSPEADPYVKEGDVLSPDTILCIVEAMKVMNEIPAGTSGVVREILVKNGESVEFGQPLFRVEEVE
jgi:acetyl-CoA carboxylase biotin carboxyl carrier protein